MAKFKALKSIAHNLAHSHFSLVNYIDDDYAMEHLFRVCKTEGISEFVIDVINKSIEPAVFMTDSNKKGLIGLERHAEKLLAPNGFKLDDLMSFKLYVNYDFDNTLDDIHHVYDLKSVIIDQNGKEHVSKVVEWWKY